MCTLVKLMSGHVIFFVHNCCSGKLVAYLSVVVTQCCVFIHQNWSQKKTLFLGNFLLIILDKFNSVLCRCYLFIDQTLVQF